MYIYIYIYIYTYINNFLKKGQHMNSAMTCGPTLGLSGVLQCVAVICTVVGFKIELIEVLQYVACVAVCCSVS